MVDAGLAGKYRTIVMNRLASVRAAGAAGSSPKSDEHPVRLQSIVVPLDGSEFAEHALPLAIAMARRTGAVLRLLYVFPPFETMFSRTGAAPTTALERYLKGNALEYLRETDARIGTVSREITLITQLVEARNVADAICHAAEKADFMVMATRGRGWLGRVWNGSIARDVMKTSHCPVVFVRGSDTPVALAEGRLPRHLVLPLDGTRSAERVFESAGLMARVSGAEITLLHIEDANESDASFPHRDANAYLASTRRTTTALFPKASTQVLPGRGAPARAVMDYADQHGGDMLAVASRDGGSLLRSGVADTLIRKSKSPVLVLGEH